MGHTSSYHRFHIGILDDHFYVRNAFRSAIRNFSYVKKVSVFSASSALLKHLRDREADSLDMLLLDVRLANEENGLLLCRSLKQDYKHLRILMMGTYVDQDYSLLSERHNADGYIFKGAGEEDLRYALDTILLHGRRYNISGNGRRGAEKKENYLTRMEIAVMNLVIGGYTNKKIAEELILSYNTIRTHRWNIMKKTGTHNAASLLQYALANGYMMEK